jgi:membrane protein insertase Oxa1/YidC/SpoIIIJ
VCILRSRSRQRRKLRRSFGPDWNRIFLLREDPLLEGNLPKAPTAVPMRTPLLRPNIFRVSRTAQARQFSSSPHQRFGFDPIEITALLFRSFHDVSGLTYGIAIPLTTVALRTLVTLPLSIYSQRKLQRRLELRPLFAKWGEVKGMLVVAEQKARNLDLKGNKQAMSEAMSRVRKMVLGVICRISK